MGRTKKSDIKTSAVKISKAKTAKARKSPRSPTGVQAHGKKWENEIISVIVSPSKVDEAKHQPYTAVHDIPKYLNKLSGRNVSIKATGKKTVDFGDALRVVNNLQKDSPLEAIVISYKQNGELKEPTSVLRFDLTSAKDVLLGKNIDALTDRIKTLDRMLKTGDPNANKLSKEITKEMKNNGAYMSLRPKIVNPKKKRYGRLQISISNIDTLVKDHPELILENEGCNIYGKQCLSVLESSRRVLTKKTPKTLISAKSRKAAKSIIDGLSDKSLSVIEEGVEEQEEL